MSPRQSWFEHQLEMVERAAKNANYVLPPLKKRNLMQKLIAYWHSLPAWLKYSIVIFVGGASGVLKHQLADSHDCLTWACIKEYVVSGLHGGVLALIAYLMPPPNSGGTPPNTQTINYLGAGANSPNPPITILGGTMKSLALVALCLALSLTAFAQTTTPAPAPVASAFADTTVSFGLTAVTLPSRVTTLSGAETDILLNVSANNVLGESNLISGAPFLGGRYIRLFPSASKWIQEHSAFTGGHFQVGATTSFGVVKSSTPHYGERFGFVLNYAPEGSSTFGLGLDVEANNLPGIARWVPSIAIAPTFHF
jgi:hypothetical protein